jgi:ABC-type transport system substrate-binding protein
MERNPFVDETRGFLKHVQHLGGRPVGRRTLLKFGVGATVATLISACGGDDDDDDAEPTANLNPVQPTNVPQPTVQSGAASPTATTAATPTATTAAQASPTTSGEAEFQKIGELTLRTEPYPEYAGTPVDSETLTMIRAEELTELSPTALFAYSPFTFILDPGTFIDEFSLEVEPWLIQKWELSEDGTTYTISLRDDVVWHDDDPLTGEDVAWSFVAYRDDPDSGVARFFVLMEEDPIVIDEHTVEVKLSSTSGDFLANTCNQFIMQKKQFIGHYETNKNEEGKGTLTGYDFVANKLIGTGAWKLTGYQPDEGVLEMERNENYWVQVPHFKKFIFRHVPDPASRILAWKNGETDLLWPITATDIDQVQDEDAWLYSAYAVAYMAGWFNFGNTKPANPGVFESKEVRQALMHAIDRDGYAEAIFHGFIDQNAYGTVAFPWAYNKDVPHYEYDPDKALELLGTAGWTLDGDKLVDASGTQMQLVAITINAPGYPVDKVAEVVQEDFRKIGIAMTIEKLEAAAIRDRRRETRDYDIELQSRILFAGFNDYNYFHSSFDLATNPQGRNNGYVRDEVDRLVEAISKEPDLEKQKELLYEFQNYIADDLPALWFGFPRDLILVRKNIQGYQPNSMWQYWNTWSLWRTEA